MISSDAAPDTDEPLDELQTSRVSACLGPVTARSSVVMRRSLIDDTVMTNPWFCSRSESSGAAPEPPLTRGCCLVAGFPSPRIERPRRRHPCRQACIGQYPGGPLINVCEAARPSPETRSTSTFGSGTRCLPSPLPYARPALQVLIAGA
jgi:hypothetical protein